MWGSILARSRTPPASPAQSAPRGARGFCLQRHIRAHGRVYFGLTGELPALL